MFHSYCWWEAGARASEKEDGGNGTRRCRQVLFYLGSPARHSLQAFFRRGGGAAQMWTVDGAVEKLTNPFFAFGLLISSIGWSWLGPIGLVVYIPAGWSISLLVFTLYRRLLRLHLDWSDQIAVVTGSSGGLGAAIVEELRAKGCRVVAVDVVSNAAFVEDSQCVYLQADFSDRQQVEALPDAIRAKLGGQVTIFISNAGVMVGRKVLDFDEGQFEKTIAINFLATYYGVRAFLPAMLASGRGHIVATGSVMSYVGISQLTDYVASKHALVGFMESLRYELDKKYKAPGIKTSLLVLGKLSTPLFARAKISWVAETLTPTQRPITVAKALIDRLDRCEGGTIYRPHLARFSPLLKAVPQWLRNGVQSAAGADEALEPL